jgi:hypothetical protein
VIDMKRIGSIAAGLLLLTGVAAAQEQTLINGEIDHGGYGALTVKTTRVNGETGVMMGAAGAWVIDHTVLVGFEGSGLVNRVEGNKLQASGEPYILRLNEGGIRIGYIHNSDDALHFTASTMIGAGSMTLSERFVWTDDDDFAWDIDQMYMIIEPEVAAELNITKWMRAQVGASYRIVTGADYEGMTSTDLSGPAGTVTLKFGVF